MNKQKDRQTNEQIELTDIKTDTQTPHHIKTDNNFLYLHFPIRNASSVFSLALFANWNKMKHVTLFHSVLFSICNEYSIKRSNELMTQRGYNIIFIIKSPIICTLSELELFYYWFPFPLNTPPITGEEFDTNYFIKSFQLFILWRSKLYK